MTDEEIFKRWRDSTNPRKQVQILADLNSKKKREIVSILLDQCQKHSFTAPGYLKDASGDDIGAKIEELAAKDFYCKQIADTMGISEFRVKSYCDKHGIQLAKADRFGNIIWAPERGGELKSDFKLDPVTIPQKKRVTASEPIPEPETAPEPVPVPENKPESGGNANVCVPAETDKLEPLPFADMQAVTPSIDVFNVEHDHIGEIADFFAARVQESGGSVHASIFTDGTVIIEMRVEGGDSK